MDMPLVRLVVLKPVDTTVEVMAMLIQRTFLPVLPILSTRIHSHIVFVSLLFLYARDTYEGSSWDPYGHV